ncbi:MAG: MAPEG family protein [Gemmatimonadota bacterium]
MTVTNGMDWPALVTLGVLTLGFATAWLVGHARVKYGVKAPATTGHEMFERAYRVQMNTLENTVIFLPALWLAAFYIGPLASTALGGVWLAGRIWYAIAYMANPKKRGGGFTLAYVAWALLMLGTAWGVLNNLAGK